MKAILTADIVNSSLLAKKDFEKLIKSLQKFFQASLTDFYGGDSFRVLVDEPSLALLNCVKSRLLAIQFSAGYSIDIRISINIGQLQSDPIDLRSSTDELLVASGRGFAKLQATQQRLSISCGDKAKDFTYEIIAEYMDGLLRQVTAKQASVIYELLSGKSQVETAAALKLSTATISKQVKAARYDEIRNLLHKFEILTNQLPNGI